MSDYKGAFFTFGLVMGAAGFITTLNSVERDATAHLRQGVAPERLLLREVFEGEHVGLVWSDGTYEIEHIETGVTRRVSSCIFNNPCCWVKICGSCCCLACDPPQCSECEENPDIKGGA